MSPATLSRPTAETGSAVERAQSWLSPLNLHWAGVGLLALVNLYLLAHMALLWHSAGTRNADAMAQQRIALRTAEIAASPLRGLDGKLAEATEDADRFSSQRLPGMDSEVLAEIGALTKKQGVRLARVQYAPAPVLLGSAGELTEMRLDASLSGDYRPLVQFINTLERDRMFFVIRGVTLTGQQSGTVNLRLRLTTYLRDGMARQLPQAGELPGGGTESAAPVANSGEGSR